MNFELIAYLIVVGFWQFVEYLNKWSSATLLKSEDFSTIGYRVAKKRSTYFMPKLEIRKFQITRSSLNYSSL